VPPKAKLFTRPNRNDTMEELASEIIYLPPAKEIQEKEFRDLGAFQRTKWSNKKKEKVLAYLFRFRTVYLRRK
jgi:hypothetical protein